jgi:hypothetical protein
MNNNGIDQQLLQIVSATAPTDVVGVLAVMKAVDGILPNNDGLKWFNNLYLTVTQEVHAHPPAPGWADPIWVARLDVVFADLYFKAIGGFLTQAATVPSSWQALFEARHRPAIDRIQYALAGMNAHINHDLSQSLLQANDDLHIVPSLASPEHNDFERVNGIFETVLPATLKTLATDVLGEIAQDTGKIGRLLAIWDVRVARDLAWDFADHLRNLSGLTREMALRIQDKFTGALGRTLLLAL